MLNSIGKWKVFALETGDFYLDGGAMMGSVPKVLWKLTNPPDKLNRIKLALRCLLLDDGHNKILIETGIGNKISHSFIKRFNIQQSNDPVKQCLNNIGYQLDEITHVLLTHLHFDHSGGAVQINSKDEIVPTFPKAKYFISKSNWNIGLNPSPRDSASYLDVNYKILKDKNRLQLVSDNIEILDGISTISINGHTNGQQLFKIESEGECLVFCSDLIPLKSHLKLPWIMGYDLNAALTLKEKTVFLNNAEKNGWWLWFYHDPDTIAVKIKTGEKYYEISEEVLRNV